MEVPFNTLPDSARIWIYQGNRAFTKSEQKILSEGLSSFLQRWTAHGNALNASFALLYDQFIVIGLDESAADASGCSIDSLVRNLQGLASTLTIDFFNRELIGFLQDQTVQLVPRNQVKDFLTSVGGKVLTFNNLVSNVKAFHTDWLVPAETTWLKRYLSPISA
jgi:hypothetical protein